MILVFLYVDEILNFRLTPWKTPDFRWRRWRHPRVPSFWFSTTISERRTRFFFSDSQEYPIFAQYWQDLLQYLEAKTMRFQFHNSEWDQRVLSLPLDILLCVRRSILREWIGKMSDIKLWDIANGWTVQQFLSGFQIHNCERQKDASYILRSNLWSESYLNLTKKDEQIQNRSGSFVKLILQDITCNKLRLSFPGRAFSGGLQRY